MKKIFTYFKKKYLFLLAFLVSTLLSIGASTWLVIRENEFKPGYVKLQTPIVLSYTITNPSVYEYQIEDANGEVTLNTLMRVCGISITPDVSVNGSVNCTNLDEIYFVSNTTGNPYEVKANFTFTPNDQDNYLEASVEVPIKINPICYAGSNYYGSLNRALAAAGTTPVAIIPGHKDFIIHRDVTIGSGQTVVVPYDTYWNNSTITNSNGEVKTDGAVGWDKKEPNAKGTIYHQYSGTTTYAFADTNSTTVGTYKKTEITLAENRTITNLGELSVLGELGGYTHGLSGHTSGRYAQITLKSNAKIDNQGLMEVRGYVKEASATNGSQVINQNGGELNLPFVIYDNQGARPTIGMYMAGNIFPYNGFNFPNIHSKIISYGNSNIYGLGSMFTGSLSAGLESIGLSIKIDPQHNLIKIPLFIAHNSTTSGVFVLSSATSRVEMTYTPYNFGYTENKWSNGRDANYSMRGVTDINFFGGANTGYISLSIFLGNPDPIVLDTRGTNFPISWLLDIEFNDGEYEITQQLKIMSGARLQINFGATLYVSSPTVVYSTFNDVVSGESTEYPYISNQNGLLIGNGGNITIAAQFGGIVHAQGNQQSTLNITTTNLTNTIIEGTGGFSTDPNDIVERLGGWVGGGVTNALQIMDYMNGKASVTFNSIKGHIIKLSSAQFVDPTPTETARGYQYTKGVKSSSYENFAQTRYYSSNGGWYTGEYTINVTFNYNNGTDPITYPIKVGNHQQLTINESFLKQFEIEREHYIFNNWTLENGNSPLGTINSDITIYANWEAKQYTIDYDIQYLYGSSYEEGDQIIYEFENPSGFTIDSEDMTFYHPTHSRFFVFKGWYYDSTYKSAVIDDLSVLSAETLSDYLVDNKVTLYGYWTVENMDINYISTNNDKVLTSSRVPIYQDAFNEFDLYEQSYIVDSDVTYSKYVEGFYKDEACTIRVEGLTLDYFTAEEFDEMAENKLLTIYVKWADKLTVNYTDPSNTGYTLPSSEFVAPTLLNEYTFENGAMDDQDGELSIPIYFVGWSYNGIAIDSFADLSEEQLTAIKTAGTVTLATNWANKVVVTFVDESINGYASETIYLNPTQLRTYDLETYETDMDSGDTTITQPTYFNGWKYNDTAITSFADLSSSVLDSIINAGSVTIKADWANKIHIKYMKILDGSVVANSSETIKYLLTSQLDDNNVNTVALADQSGQNNDYSYQYYFMGWYKNVSIENKYLLTNTSTTVSLKDMDVTNNEIIIYHAWETKVKITVKISSSSNGAKEAKLSANGYTWSVTRGNEGSFYIRKQTGFTLSGDLNIQGSSVELANTSTIAGTIAHQQTGLIIKRNVSYTLTVDGSNVTKDGRLDLQ